MHQVLEMAPDMSMAFFVFHFILRLMYFFTNYFTTKIYFYKNGSLSGDIGGDGISKVES